MSFIYKEAINPRYFKHLPDSLNLNKSIYVEAKLVRLLLGTVDIEYPLARVSILQRKNYSNTLGNQNALISTKIIRDSLKPLQFSDIDLYFKRFKNINYSLHDELLFEFSLYFLNKHKNNHVTAFLHTYRLLEFMSYFFPLSHASLSRNYIGTFKSLQSYFQKDGGELEFIVTFINKLFDDPSLLSTTLDIGITAPTTTIQNKTYSLYKKFLPAFATFDDSRKMFSIPLKEIIPATIFLRNRYFHFAIGGQKNIRSSEIEYPEIFFSQFNETIINWLVMVYFEVLKTNISNWKKY